ncbi:Class E vacuolar protein-sorting machinery protein hse2 [Pseudohyphozyma bogoriensis]|nr:Class E vacuolar protein-sorting machinery protein hse2 [Pseudohyphozyma bogoriensis]
MSAPYLQHILQRLTTDLDFLASQSHISQADLSLIKSKLPSAAAAAATSGLETGVAGLSVGEKSSENVGGGVLGGAARPAGGQQRCRALWDHHQNQPDDLGFQKGDIITIEQEMNPDWWRGSFNGRSGLFPANHVERIDPAPVFERSQASIPPPPPQHSNSGYNSGYPNNNAPWTGPGGNYSQPPMSYTPPTPYGQPQNHHYGSGAPPPNAYAQAQFPEKQPYVPPPPPPQTYTPPAPSAAPAPAAAPPIPEKKHKFGGKLGGVMATSFAGGVGFGAGSSLANNAINAIF